MGGAQQWVRCLAASLAIAWSSVAASAETGSNTPPDLADMIDRAVGFLQSEQAEDGSFSSHAGPGVTALIATGIMRHGRTEVDPVVARSLAYLEKYVQPDGGIYQPKTLYRNYETCLAILCFAEANRDGRYDDLLHKAESYVKGLQWDEGEGHDRSSNSFGGAGYGKHNRPDMSNTTFLMDVLKARGCGPDDPAVKNLLAFVSRCQNLETEHNQTKFPTLNPDGGFYYTVAAGGSSQAGTTETGGLRSYGSMTYAGLKSMIYAGVAPDDPRVQAALGWAKKNFTVRENPGLGDAGLFYYYHTFAKALSAIGEDQIVDDSGVAHDWKKELIAELASRQSKDGSWTNTNRRWFESDPNLVTGYVLLTLSYCRE